MYAVDKKYNINHCNCVKLKTLVLILKIQKIKEECRFKIQIFISSHKTRALPQMTSIRQEESYQVQITSQQDYLAM